MNDRLDAPLNLQCEFAADPIGVVRLAPRLSWWVNDSRPAEMQSSYEIIASSSSYRLNSGYGDLWQSGLVEGSTSANATYAGTPLESGQTVYWKVRTFDSDGIASPWSLPARFEMGLLENDDWCGDWISTPLSGSRTRPGSVPVMRYEFDLNKPLFRARFYLAVAGDYRLFVNQRGISRCVWPGVWSDFDQVLYFQTYSLEDALQSGNNTLDVLLADGFYAGQIADRARNAYGEKACLRSMLKLEYEDGRVDTIGSSDDWRWQASAVVAAETNSGEHIDARGGRWYPALPQVHDTSIDYLYPEQEIVVAEAEPNTLAAWQPVEVLPPLHTELVAQNFRGPETVSLLRASHLPQSHMDHEIAVQYLDFGRTLVGRVQLQLECQASDGIKIEYCLNTEFTQPSVDSYTSGESRMQVFEPLFAVHSFRYVRISFHPRKTAVLDVLALQIAIPELLGMRLDTDHVGLNQLYTAMRASVEASSFSVPFRGLAIDARLPEVLTTQTWLPTLAQHVGAYELVRKWVTDMRFVSSGAQGCRGLVPDVPGLGQTGLEADLAVFESFVDTLWSIYRYQGDVTLLTDCYPQLRASVLSYQVGNGGYIRTLEKGDHSAHVCPGASPWVSQLVATCAMYGRLLTAARIAYVVGELADVAMVEGVATQVRDAFRARFVTPDGYLAAQEPAAYVAALFYRLLEPEEVQLAETALIEAVQADDFEVRLPASLHHAFLHVLTAAQRVDLAYSMLLSPCGNLWLDGTLNTDASPRDFDITKLGVLQWLQEAVVGIELAGDLDVVCHQRLIIRPRPLLGTRFLKSTPVRSLHARLATTLGEVEVHWRIHARAFELQLTLPPSCAAVVVMPDGIEQSVQSGSHRFMMDFDAGGDGIPTLLELTGS
ncbi:MAG: family 78 glycoside hydrolase catalytic domain [Pseudomonadota bacterium]